MKTHQLLKVRAAYLITVILCFLVPSSVNAHCDTMNGPVVTAAKKALETGNVNLVLIWVQKKDEADIRAVFQKTLAVRKLSSDARNLADLYFFETLVRIHRAGEGVPYTGLKPAETVIDPGIAAADKSLETGSAEGLLEHLNEAVQGGIHHQFEQVLQKKNFKADDIEAGREYVKVYVEFIHYVERLHEATTKPAIGHYHEAEGSEEH